MARALARVRALLILLASSCATAQITGFHVDSESCSGLLQDNKTQQLVNCAKFFGSLESLSAKLSGVTGLPQGPLRVAVDAGTGWVCGAASTGCFNLTWKNKTAPVSDHVVDLAQEVVLMDYTRNVADLYKRALPYLAYADTSITDSKDAIVAGTPGHPASHRSIRVGVAISSPLEPAASWQTRSEQELEALLVAGQALLGKHPSFGGFSVFTQGTWMAQSSGSRAVTTSSPTGDETGGRWPVASGGIGAWYLDHSIVTNATASYAARTAWLAWARQRGISEVYLAPHASNDPLIAIPGRAGSAAVEKVFCDFIHVAQRGPQPIAVQLIAAPLDHDLSFVKNCSRRNA